MVQLVEEDLALCLMDLCQAVVRQPDLADLAGLGQRDDLFDPSWRIERIMDPVIIHLLAPKQMRADLKHLTDSQHPRWHTAE